MEHFKRLAFCMLYLFTFIWQLSAQVKKIPQWGAVRDSVARYCQRNFISDVAGDNINKKKVCQNAHLHYFTYKAPTFTSWGFVIT